MSEGYKVTGKITAISPSESISGGMYNKMSFAVTNNDGYKGAEKLWGFEIFEKSEGDRIANFNKFNSLGQVVDVSFEIRTNENAGRYFTSLSAWKVFKADGTAGIDTPIEGDEVLDEEIAF